jgi:tripartite-type tricarboxylate transporter receptor subunit TctC
MKRLRAALAAFAMAATLIPSAHAAEWPAKPVRIIVPYAAGGANDLLARVFGERLSEAFGQQFSSLRTAPAAAASSAPRRWRAAIPTATL